MVSLELKKAIIKAGQECHAKKTDIDIYQNDQGIAVKQRSLRRSGKHIIRVSYEKGNAVVRDNKGKEIEKISGKTKPEIEQSESKAEKAKSKGNKDS